jgi:hypothetical protein
MGNTQIKESKEIKQQIDDSSVVEGHYVNDSKTGYRWATAPIVSDSSVQKIPQPVSLPGLPGEIWGPYPKKFTRSMFGQNLFTPPESVDGVPILCRCRDINDYVRSTDGSRILNAIIALGAGASPPACWEDDGSIMNPYGGMTFRVNTRHPAFYEYMINRDGRFGIMRNLIVGGRRTKRKLRKTRKIKKSKR